ncbi:MAG: tetratricopeptide repeat protein [Bacteroidota bacterium]|nr:tetratricopeptide repeat protein [Rhodothermia bacterium]MCS7155791.1 tetratricopeptide repeat protein [Bacteroidota bacterium]MDW8138236.1 tetratricopeptide repeat protein [Bacteroidota bacterium]MDW8285920.1 tetratricopeptide repeat protein [Bacteroidota bacterium]
MEATLLAAKNLAAFLEEVERRIESGELSEALLLCRQALEQLPEHERSSRVRIELEMANAYLRLKDPKVFDLLNRIPVQTDLERAIWLVRYGSALLRLHGDSAGAREQFERAYLLFRELHEYDWMVRVMTNIGNTYRAEHNFEQAQEAYSRAYNLAKRHGLRRRFVFIFNNKGVCFQDENRFDEAEDYLKRAYTLARELGDRLMEATTLANLADLYEAMGYFGLALEYYRAALQLYRELGAIRDYERKYAAYERCKDKLERLDIAKVLGFMDLQELRQRYVTGLVDGFIGIPGIRNQSDIGRRIGLTRQAIHKNVRQYRRIQFRKNEEEL